MDPALIIQISSIHPCAISNGRIVVKPNRLDILMVTDHFLPDFFGGSIRVVLELGKRLAARGHVLHLLTMNANPSLASEEWIQGIHVTRFRVNWQGLWIYPTAIFGGRRAFQILMKKVPPDVIHFHLPFSTLGILSSPHSKGLPKIFTYHGPAAEEMILELGERESSSIKGFLYKNLYLKVLGRFWRNAQGKCLSATDRVVVLSEYSKNNVLNLPYAPAPSDIVLIPGGVDVEKFRPSAEEKSPIRIRLGLPADGLLVLSIRRLVPRMGLENLIAAIRMVLKKKANVYLVIGGKGPLEGRLRSMISSLGLEKKIILTGFIPEDVLPLFYQAADLFVLPTLALEGFGLPVVEAMACGLPVVVTPMGASAEIISRFDPDLITSGTSPKDLANSILDFVSLKAGNVDLSLRCRTFVEFDYSWENIVTRYEDLYFQVIDEKSRKMGKSLKESVT